jgi:hypothetical protein
MPNYKRRLKKKRIKKIENKAIKKPENKARDWIGK